MDAGSLATPTAPGPAGGDRFDSSGTTGEPDDLSAVPADHAAVCRRAAGLHAAAGVAVRERDEQRECVDECAEHGCLRLGGLLAEPGNHNEPRRKYHQGYRRLFADLDRRNSVVPDRHSKLQSERSAGGELVADHPGSRQRDADELKKRAPLIVIREPWFLCCAGLPPQEAEALLGDPDLPIYSPALLADFCEGC